MSTCVIIKKLTDMEKRLNIIAGVNMMCYVLVGLTHVLQWPKTVAMVAAILAVAVLGVSVVNIVLACKEGPVTRKFHMKRIIYQMVIAAALVAIYIGKFC